MKVTDLQHGMMAGRQITWVQISIQKCACSVILDKLVDLSELVSS